MPTRQAARPPLTPALQVLATIALAALLVYGGVSFLGRIQATLILVVAAVFLAYLIYPLLKLLTPRMPLVAALAIVYLVIAALVALVLIFFVPPLIADTSTFIRGMPVLVTNLSRDIADPQNPIFGWLPQPVRDYAATLPSQFVGLVRAYGLAAAQQVAGYLLSVVAIVAALIVVPVLSAYILLDSDNILRTVIGLVPERGREKAKAIVFDLDQVLGGFIRGQLIDAVIVGALIFVVLTILRVPYAYLVAVFSGVFQIVPYVGAIMGFVPAVTLAFINNGPTNAVGVAIAFATIHQVDGNFIAPRIMRGTVGLAPIWVILSVLLFSELFGIAGTFIAVPLAAMLRVLKMHFLPLASEVEDIEKLDPSHPLRLGDAISIEEG